MNEQCKHLLSIDDLTAKQIHDLVARARLLKQGAATTLSLGKEMTASTLFYENSTRTQLSFSLAMHRLGIPLFPLAVQQSSVKKGETLRDTLHTLAAMGISLVVMRHSESTVFESILPDLPPSLHLVNAGDGQREHPSQALLDWMTIVEQIDNTQHLRVAVLGDIRHSRVAHSFEKLCQKLDIKQLTFIAPSKWAPETVQWGKVTDQLAEGLEGADVIMTLRVQRERLLPEEQGCLKTYHQQYGLTQAALAYAQPSAIVLHPGPINRGVEISDEVADGVQSCILKQVTNGVWMRMAILEWLLS